MKTQTKVTDEIIKKLLGKGKSQERLYGDNIWVGISLMGLEEDWKAFKQEEIDRIKIPPYVPRGFLRAKKFWSSEVPHNYYGIRGITYLERGQIISKGIEIEDFVKAMHERDNTSLKFKGKTVRLSIGLDSLPWVNCNDLC